MQKILHPHNARQAAFVPLAPSAPAPPRRVLPDFVHRSTVCQLSEPKLIIEPIFAAASQVPFVGCVRYWSHLFVGGRVRVIKPYPDDAGRKHEEERKDEVLVFAHKQALAEVMVVVRVIGLSPPGYGLWGAAEERRCTVIISLEGYRP